jgi:hypothetical protein
VQPCCPSAEQQKSKKGVAVPPNAMPCTRCHKRGTHGDGGIDRSVKEPLPVLSPRFDASGFPTHRETAPRRAHPKVARGAITLILAYVIPFSIPPGAILISKVDESWNDAIF